MMLCDYESGRSDHLHTLCFVNSHSQQLHQTICVGKAGKLALWEPIIFYVVQKLLP